MPNEVHAMITTSFVLLAFFFGVCCGGKLGIDQTKKAYGYSHEKLFLRK
jgi:hypothetical protein